MKVLFVCLGNICRSPTAEAVLRNMAALRQLPIKIDSAGTAAYHIGKSPDSRSQQAALKRGISMEGLSARQAKPEDFYEFDYIFAMDESNYQNLMAIKPENPKAELSLFLSEFGTMGPSDVPDPYYGDGDGFELVLDLLEDACEQFLKSKVAP
ncbi:MAG: protein-tyrosine phosphatase [Oceanicoccus sp.]|jgi:protein-tyrosine phosphatase